MTITCVDRVRTYLDAINRHAELNSFISVFADEALDRARRIDDKIQAGSAGHLAGMILGLKDVLAYAGHPLTAASRILDTYHSPFNATAVQRLLDEDAIIIGRQNCDEFGMGSSTENSFYGPTRNPHDATRTPGGSSGGSAAAVAANLCDVSLGSDTGGSVRQPAAFCGVYGLKPTYSRVSRYGLVAYASSFDTIGIIAREVSEIARVLSVIAGPDEYDSTVSKQPVPRYATQKDTAKKFRVAVFRNILDSPGLQPEVRDSLHAAIKELRSKGNVVDLVDFPLLDYLLPTYYILATAEASANLQRYDGVRYGYRQPGDRDLEAMYKKTRSIGFGKEVQRRILLGTFVLSSDYHDTYYAQAQKVRRLIRDETKRLLQQADILLMPTAPTTAFPLGASSDPLTMYLADVFSVQANVAGVPAISFPYGKDKQGLPIGLQAVADDFQEDVLFQFALGMGFDR